MNGSSEPSSSQMVSMFRPITAFDADICLIRLKRGMVSAVRPAATRLRFSPATTPAAPKAISRPPARSMS